MAKAHIKTPDGIVMNLDGTPQEIIAIMRDLKASHTSASKTAEKTAKWQPSDGSINDRIISLADGNFFKQPRDLASIKAALAQDGHHYPVTTLSPLMLRLVRKRILRRIKQEKRWMYTR